MTIVTDFKMAITDIFKLADGRTVFVGPIDGAIGLIAASKCELFVDGIHRFTISIEGEMIPDGSHPEGHRAVSTKELVPLERGVICTSKCYLKSHNK